MPDLPNFPSGNKNLGDRDVIRKIITWFLRQDEVTREKK
jgi:hypothetical protein